MSDEKKFDFKKRWLALSPDERDEFASEAGTTSHYIQTHLTRKSKIPGKKLMDRIFKACKKREWISNMSELTMFFYAP
ncbi:hypothetical protein AB1287_10350 [Enterobacter asburiae]|uniref:hypothetical protein n=1 Tax=Scandinavium sp. UTDF21-P1B TaxID=3446379 RepID=UPI003481B12F